MPHSTCSVDGCEAVTGVKGTARGLCSKHYNRLLRNGDPLIRTKRQVIGTCTLPDCGKPHDAKGLCSAHLTNLRRHGEPQPRKIGEIRDGKKVCSQCKEDKSIGEYNTFRGKPYSWCKPCIKAYRYALRVTDPDKHRKIDAAYSGIRAEQRRDAARKRRALKKNATVENVSARSVFDRDSWGCMLCGEAIPRVVLWPHPLSASLDHVVPLARGGSHAYTNVQSAHLICNMRKGDMIVA